MHIRTKIRKAVVNALLQKDSSGNYYTIANNQVYDTPSIDIRPTVNNELLPVITVNVSNSQSTPKTISDFNEVNTTLSVDIGISLITGVIDPDNNEPTKSDEGLTRLLDHLEYQVIQVLNRYLNDALEAMQASCVMILSTDSRVEVSNGVWFSQLVIQMEIEDDLRTKIPWEEFKLVTVSDITKDENNEDAERVIINVDLEGGNGVEA